MHQRKQSCAGILAQSAIESTTYSTGTMLASARSFPASNRWLARSRACTAKRIRTGADGRIAVMIREHETAGDLLRRIRELTNDVTVPREACNTWRALWLGLEALESDLHEHIHLENNILFPRALDGV